MKKCLGGIHAPNAYVNSLFRIRRRGVLICTCHTIRSHNLEAVLGYPEQFFYPFFIEIQVNLMRAILRTVVPCPDQ
jgi:hypothetical protein